MNLAKYCQKDLDKYYFYINRVSVESENAKNKEQQHVLNVFSYFDVYFKSTHLTIPSNTLVSTTKTQSSLFEFALKNTCSCFYYYRLLIVYSLLSYFIH